MRTYKDTLDPHRKNDRIKLYGSYIFRVLGVFAAVTAAAMMGPVPITRMFKGVSRINGQERKKLYQALQRLEKRGLIRRKRRDDGNEYLLLTEAGEQAWKREKFRDIVLKRPASWDKKWRIVIFDIKEDKKNVRDAIRKHLRRLHFYPLQKSVFTTPFPCEEEIGYLQKFYEADSEICLILATSLGQKEVSARKRFGL